MARLRGTRLPLIVSAASIINLAAAEFQLDPFGDNSIRIRVAPPGQNIVNPELQALLLEAPTLTTSVSWEGSNSLTNGNLQVTVDPSTGYLTATRLSDGRVLLKQTELTWGPVSVPGTRAGSVTAAVSFAGTPGEKIYGLGEHRTGTVQQSPYNKTFAESQLYATSRGSDVSIPWYASSQGYGFVWNSPSFGSVDVSEAAITWESVATLNVDVWVTTTSADPALDPSRSPYADLLRHYVDAVGHAPPMPYYATGFIQCKDRYRNQTQLLEVAHGYVDRGLPISVIVIDWQHWVNQGDWSFNPRCWPDPQGMVDELQTLGIEPMVTFWPFQTLAATHWAQYNSSGFLAPNVSGALLPYDSLGSAEEYLVDTTNADARNATFEAFWQGYGRFGFKTIWLDAAEPETESGSVLGTTRLAAGTNAEVGEAWTQQHVRTFADGFASRGIGPSDYFVLPRSAWAGSWRHSAALWSGDIASTFDELRIQISVLQGVMMSGPVLWTTDIGGYWNGDVNDPVFRNLIVRWFQFGAFCPLFRLHGHRAGGPPENECGPTNGYNEVWNLAPDAPNYAGIAAVMRLRENLREYVSQINAEAAATGMPMVRPMFLQFPNDPSCQGSDVEDQYMFGPDWLVAPVYEFNASSRSVYLPPLDGNHSWVYFFNETVVYPGGARVDVPTPIEEFPLFYVRPNPAPVPLALANATSFYSAERGDSVLCLSAQCLSDNVPTNPGAYVQQRVEAVGFPGVPDGGAAVINGTSYPTAQLTLWYSFEHEDNFVATNATPPDASYGKGTVFANGAVLTAQAPGSLPLQVWYKARNTTSWDYATVASAEGLAWVAANGYAYQWTTGFVFPPAQ